jgi:hypothetical protein
MTQYNPTTAVTNNMQRGIALKNKYSSRENQAYQTTVQQVQKAQDILDKGFDLGAIKEIYNKLSALEKSVDFRRRLSDKGPTEDIIKFYSFGGSAGLAWARSILKQEGILKSYNKPITDAELNKDGDDKVYGGMKIAKALNEEMRLATFVVLEPQDDDGLTTDLHGDTYTADMIEKSCINFNRFCQKANLLHMVDTEGYSFVESYVTRGDVVIGEKLVKAGSWIATIYVEDNPVHDWIWQGIKDGAFNGLSVQCMATTEALD